MIDRAPKSTGLDTELVKRFVKSPQFAIANDELYADRFELDGLLGNGRTAQVWDAIDRKGGARLRVALKVYDTLSLEGLTDQFFRTECLRARTINHAGVVRVIDAKKEEGEGWIAYEYMTGGSLESARLLNHITRTPREWAVAFAGLARALASIHAAGLIHRDLKPANILIDGDGTLKIADLGIAHGIGDETGLSFGTPAHSAPEQLEGAQPHVAQDIYGLAGTLLFMLTRDRPNSGAATMTGVPGELGAILRKALAPDPSDRHRSADELAGDLLAFAERRPAPSMRAGVRKRLALFALRRPYALSASVVFALMLAGGVVLGHNYSVSRAELAAEQDYRKRMHSFARMMSATSEKWSGSQNFDYAVTLATRQRALAEVLGREDIAALKDKEIVDGYRAAFHDARGNTVRHAAIGLEFAFLLTRSGNTHEALTVIETVRSEWTGRLYKIDRTFDHLDHLEAVCEARLALDRDDEAALYGAYSRLSEYLNKPDAIDGNGVHILLLAAHAEVCDALGYGPLARELEEQLAELQNP